MKLKLIYTYIPNVAMNDISDKLTYFKKYKCEF